MHVIRAIVGLAIMIVIAWLLSANRRRIDWRMVGMGLTLQILMAVLTLKVQWPVL